MCTIVTLAIVASGDYNHMAANKPQINSLYDKPILACLEKSIDWKSNE